MRLRHAIPALALAAAGSMAVSATAQAHLQVTRRDPALAATSGIQLIKHVIVIMQENRSFDSYFGKFPGADGIPNGVCLPDPRNGGCDKPWGGQHHRHGNGPHGREPFNADLNGG